MNTAAGVAVFLAGIIIVRAVWSRANPGARLAAIGGVALALWLFVGIAAPHQAGTLAAWLAQGVATDALGAAHLISAI